MHVAQQQEVGARIRRLDVCVESVLQTQRDLVLVLGTEQNATTDVAGEVVAGAELLAVADVVAASQAQARAGFPEPGRTVYEA